MIDRPKFKELTYEQVTDSVPENYDLVQVKMDGIWGCMVIKDGQLTIYSRTGKVKFEKPLEENSPIEGILLGEYMKGSHWGHKMGIDGNFYVFDCINYNGEDITDMPLTERLQMAEAFLMLVRQSCESSFIAMLGTFPSQDWSTMWDNLVTEKQYEGLVFKDSNSKYSDKGAWARLKNVIEIEYVCHSFRPADEGTRYEGQVGAVIGTLDDKEVYVTCSGLTDAQRLEYTANGDDYIGKVFTAKGNGWYPSGSIRHPKFKTWREDKTAEECSFEQIPEIMR
jgi:ATP-dependent DNA ligase|tara:strand:+ start:78 stop:920 length:843 start_codon:yes stop_codon:yes gene_type:complete